MRKYHEAALLSASDPVNFTGCRHCTFLDLRELAGGEQFEAASDPGAELLQQKGIEHERAFLSSLIERKLRITQILDNCTLEKRVEHTRRAMREGVSRHLSGRSARASLAWLCGLFEAR